VFQADGVALNMIRVENLYKYYGEYPAVRGISFQVPKGRVVGFLGPNGAGKSTTMRILAGFLTASSGKASIDVADSRASAGATGVVDSSTYSNAAG
jgi:ABC-type multidrug transport system ATPase subunit